MRAFLLLCLALLVGCSDGNKGGTISIPIAPAYTDPSDTTPISRQVILQKAAQILPGVPIILSHNSYTRVDHEWMVAMVNWSWYAAKALQFEYTNETENCQDFSLAFYEACSHSAALARKTTAILVGRISVENRVTSMNVPGAPGSRHELIGVVTDQAPYFYVIEPQPDAGPYRITPLDKYPNKILLVVFGDCTP